LAEQSAELPVHTDNTIYLTSYICCSSLSKQFTPIFDLTQTFVKIIKQLNTTAIADRASMAVFHQLSTHGQKFDPESLYEPISFEPLHPYLVNKYKC